MPVSKNEGGGRKNADVHNPSWRDGMECSRTAAGTNGHFPERKRSAFGQDYRAGAQPCKFYEDPFHFQNAEDGECIADLCVRTRSFFQGLLKSRSYQDKTILIASHGCACRGILNNVYEDKENFWHGKVPPNCAVSIVDVEDGKAVLTASDQIYYDPAECVDFRTGKPAGADALQPAHFVI